MILHQSFTHPWTSPHRTRVITRRIRRRRNTNSVPQCPHFCDVEPAYPHFSGLSYDVLEGIFPTFSHYVLASHKNAVSLWVAPAFFFPSAFWRTVTLEAYVLSTTSSERRRLPQQFLRTSCFLASIGRISTCIRYLISLQFAHLSSLTTRFDFTPYSSQSTIAPTIALAGNIDPRQ
jgi:hypothetical protein